MRLVYHLHRLLKVSSPLRPGRSPSHRLAPAKRSITALLVMWLSFTCSQPWARAAAPEVLHAVFDTASSQAANLRVFSHITGKVASRAIPRGATAGQCARAFEDALIEVRGPSDMVERLKHYVS